MFDTYSPHPDPQSLPLGFMAPLPRTYDAVAAVDALARRASRRRNAPAVLRIGGSHAPLVAPNLTSYLSRLSLRPGEMTEWVESLPAEGDVWALDYHAEAARRARGRDFDEYLAFYASTVLAGLAIHDLLPLHVEGSFAERGLTVPRIRGTSPYTRTFHRVRDFVNDHGYLPSRTEPGFEVTMASVAEFGALVRGTSSPGRGVAAFVKASTPWVAARGLFTRKWVETYTTLADHFTAEGEPPSTSRVTATPAGRLWVPLCQRYAHGKLPAAKVALLEALPGWRWFHAEGTLAHRRYARVGPASVALMV